MAHQYEDPTLARARLRNKNTDKKENSSSAAMYTELSQVHHQDAAATYTTIEHIGRNLNDAGSKNEKIIPDIVENESLKKKSECRSCVLASCGVIFSLILAIGFSIFCFLSYNQINILKSQVDILKDKELLLSEDIMKLNSSALFSTEERVFINETLNKHLSPLDVIYHNISKRINMIVKVAGLYEVYPAASCRTISLLHPSFRSDYYWVQSGNGQSIRVYCKLSTFYYSLHYYYYYDYTVPGWMRIAKLSKNHNGTKCFSGLKQSALNRSSCVAQSDSANCSHTLFSSFNIPYSRIHGIVRSYGVGTPNGFRSISQGINDNYVDGISFTYGMPPNRQHIYSFAATSGSCFLIGHRPNFVSSDYNCLTTLNMAASVCSGSSCLKYFFVQLEASTDQDIEMRVCRDQSRNDEDIVIEDIEIYVR